MNCHDAAGRFCSKGDMQKAPAHLDASENQASAPKFAADVPEGTDICVASVIDGRKEWQANGRLHRTDGPAVEYSSGFVSWWVNGQILSEEDFKAHPDTRQTPIH